MMFKKVLLLVLVSSVLLVSTRAWKDMKDRLKGRVIHFESREEPGRWLWQNDNSDTRGAKYMFADRLPERDIYYKPRVQWQVKVCGGNYLCLTPLSLTQYPHYLTAGHPPSSDKFTAKLERVDSSLLLDDNKRYHWRIFCEDDSLFKCKAVPELFEGYVLRKEPTMSNGHSHVSLAKEGPTSGLWKIHAAIPTDAYVQIFQTTNKGSTEQAAEYKTTVGISKSESSSHTITHSVSFEISSSFKAVDFSASTSLENSWENTKSSTFETAKEVTHSLKIPPKTKITLYQLIGNYAGKFNIGADNYAIEEEKLEGAKRKRYYKMRFDGEPLQGAMRKQYFKKRFKEYFQRK
ncbi:uncharacterized protein LOC116289868 [Actinia tenebrosa]|uniref:Uncharacterized protein LOC116289868 n=1 Tax=Actinia tenebrosa TaxID=6105 RepID=A0A6P8HJ94_ACTTE|nr:uncharacterized protein LOC116289868 [Actinia tenebrosa]XP_031552665.1 uncharacterized protein LOC116289868 [Actinia tenebrosa]